MSGVTWIGCAELLTPAGTAGDMLADAPPRVVWHTTEAPSGGRYWDDMVAVLRSKKAEPHLLYDPVLDRLGQFFPLDRSARALQNGARPKVSTNKTGTCCIQVEVVAFAAAPFTRNWRPGPRWDALIEAIRSWGIPDAWPAGVLSRDGEAVSRNLATWRREGGHYGHCHVPANTHWDPGGIDPGAIFTVAPATEAAPPAPATPTAQPQEDDLTDEQAQMLAETHARIMGFAQQRWWVMDKGRQVQVAAGTPGARPATALDSLDGQYLLEHGGDAVIAELRAQVAGLTKALASISAGTGADPAAIVDAAKAGAAAALADLHLVTKGA